MLKLFSRKRLTVGVQFGRWNRDGKPVPPDYLDQISPLLSPYGPDDAGLYCSEDFSVLYQAFHTTKESQRETQPHTTKSGAVLTWDGRLDNRNELITQLGRGLTAMATDVDIVSAAYEWQGEHCFRSLLGDWALSIWNPHTRSLILAKDPIGTRQLYYSLDDRQVTWSTILDPLVLFPAKYLALCEEYIAGWFSYFPATHLTPYAGIFSVPPSSSVLIGTGKHMVNKYWDFDPDKRIRCRGDAEYEDQFRWVFAESVRRRLRSSNAVLAELSGGMDSSSIVCMADTLVSQGSAEIPRLDTVSYYNDSEPNWNECPYFTKVEEKRGRIGLHIDVSSSNFLNLELSPGHFPVTPGSGRVPTEPARRVAAYLRTQGIRVVLSGIGGDEFTGGLPNPAPEFDDLLVRGHFLILARQLKLWALEKRTPWLYLFFEAVRGFIPRALVGVPKHRRPPSWLDQAFVGRNLSALHGYQTRLKLFGALPSFQDNLATLEILRRQVASDILSSDPPFERRYPFLDRSFLEFIFAIEPEQLVRPGQRRSLMRRALAGIVPDQILNRKRKAFVERTAIETISIGLNLLGESEEQMLSCLLDIVNQQSLQAAVQEFQAGLEVPLVPLLRLVDIELWLRHLAKSRVMDFRKRTAHGSSKTLADGILLPPHRDFSQLRNNLKQKGGDTDGIQQARNRCVGESQQRDPGCEGSRSHR